MARIIDEAWPSEGNMILMLRLDSKPNLEELCDLSEDKLKRALYYRGFIDEDFRNVKPFKIASPIIQEQKGLDTFIVRYYILERIPITYFMQASDF